MGVLAILAIHYVLADMGLTYKRLSVPQSKPGRMLPVPAAAGATSNEDSSSPATSLTAA